jgi:2-haloalkanoic acid dehalogenase type II
MTTSRIDAVAFDCFGTLIDFGDEAFAEAYGLICAEQGIAIDGPAFYEKWMEIWRRLVATPDATQPRSSHPDGALPVNAPAALSPQVDVPPYADGHAPSAGRNRALDGDVGPFRTYREEWTEHFALCFEELGVSGDAARAHDRMVELLALSNAFPESKRVVETIGTRLPIAMLSNADEDFLHPPLDRNGLHFAVVISSESARAYKPHVAIFRELSRQLNLPPERILYVGDSKLADVTGARNAGLQTAWLNRKRNTEWGTSNNSLLEPHHEIETLDGLLAILGIG